MSSELWSRMQFLSQIFWAYFEDTLQLRSCKFFLSYSRGIVFHRPDFPRDIGFHAPYSSEDRLIGHSAPWDPRLARLRHILDSFSRRLEFCPFSTSFRYLDIYFLCFICIIDMYLFFFCTSYVSRIIFLIYIYIYIWCSYFSFSLMSFLIYIFHMLCHFCEKKKSLTIFDSLK